jgi:long-chain acyl-CoA synthetase
VIHNVADLLARAAEEAPDGPALVDAGSGAVTTWGDLDAAVSRVAGGLAAQGLVAGNRVVVATVNRPEFVIAYLAALRARLVAVPVNPRSSPEEVVRTVPDSGARLVVADASTLPAARALPADGSVPARLVTVGEPARPGETAFDQLLQAPGWEPVPARDAEALAVLLYTSGTSAVPRAAMLSHRALLANIEQAAQVDPPMVRPDDVVYGVLPLFHVYGLNAVLGQVVRQQATLVVAESFDPERSLLDIERHRVTVVPVAPPVLAHWRGVAGIAERLGGVRTVVSGSAPLAPDVAADFEQVTGLTVQQGYGLTEAAPVVTSTLASARAKPGSVGSALPGVRIRLVDETGAEPAPGDPGEILVAGDNLFDGYWPDAADGPGDGWLATGDVGLLDADGDLFLVDRLKEIVIVSGFNVYPSEVEEVVNEVDGVLESAVVGEPDDETGEAVVAYVRVDGTRSGAAEVEQRVRERCAQRLARFKQPTRVEVVESLPHTVTGKIARGRLRSTLRRERLGLLE